MIGRVGWREMRGDGEVIIKDWKREILFREFIREFPQLLYFKMMGYDVVEIVFWDITFGRMKVDFRNRLLETEVNLDKFRLESVREIVKAAVDKALNGDYDSYNELDDRDVIKMIVYDREVSV